MHTLLCNGLRAIHAIPTEQVRAEFLDILLAVLCFAAPELERRLRSAAPGRGRSSAGSVEGAAQLFALAGTLSESAKKVCMIQID